MSGEPGPVPKVEAIAVPAAPPPMPGWKVPLYIAASVMFFLTQGLGLNLAFANLTQIQGTIAATTTESAWLSAAYMAPNVSLAIALVKIRLQYGVRNFAEVSILGFIVASLLNLFVSDLHSAIVVRFLSGIAGAPLSTLGFLYMLEAFEPAKKMTVGVSLAMTNTLLAAPITRLVSPSLLDYGEWRGLYTLEMALALLVMPIIYLLPLTPPPRVKVIVLGDIFSYLLVAIGFGCLAVVLSVGRLYWWLEVPWLGIVLAIGIASVTAAIVVDLRRSTPLIDVRWLLRPEMLHLTGILLVFRLIAAEQTSVVVTFYQNAVGLLYDQLSMLYWIILAFSVIGGLICAVLMTYGLSWQIQFVALILMGVGSLIDLAGDQPDPAGTNVSQSGDGGRRRSTFPAAIHVGGLQGGSVEGAGLSGDLLRHLHLHAKRRRSDRLGVLRHADHHSREISFRRVDRAGAADRSACGRTRQPAFIILRQGDRRQCNPQGRGACAARRAGDPRGQHARLW
nr:MFS transporter [Rhizobium sp. RCAM05973]